MCGVNQFKNNALAIVGGDFADIIKGPNPKKPKKPPRIDTAEAEKQARERALVRRRRSAGGFGFAATRSQGSLGFPSFNAGQKRLIGS